MSRLFLANLEPEVLRLERELGSGRYRPGCYTLIEIRDPKRRMVSAAPFRDRVVHHAFCRVVEPIFERGFIQDSYANRRGKGTHRAVARYERFRNRHRRVLRCDIYRYFPAIDHCLKGRRLRLHPRKTTVLGTAEPTPFLGLVLLPGGCRRLPEANVRRFRNRLRGLRDRWHAGTVDLEQLTRHVRAWIAHAEHADTWRLRQAIFRAVRFGPVRRPDRPPSAFCAAAPGTTTPGTCAPRTATGTPPRNGTTTTGSGSPVRSQAGAGVPTGRPGEPTSVQGQS